MAMFAGDTERAFSGTTVVHSVTIAEASVNVPIPKVGDKIGDFVPTIPDGANYIVGQYGWYNAADDDAPMQADDRFKAGVEYYFSGRLHANAGYVFSETPIVKLNDELTANYEFYDFWDGDIKLGVWYPFTPSAKPTHTIIRGAKSSWVPDSATGAQFVIDADFANFKGMRINGKTLGKAHYTAVEGSVIITLKSEYLETLEPGESPRTPPTGDNSDIVLLLVLMLLSGAGLLVTFRFKRKGFFRK
jgi:LPXTG-motif cell wall-anchored protein